MNTLQLSRIPLLSVAALAGGCLAFAPLLAQTAPSVAPSPAKATIIDPKVAIDETVMLSPFEVAVQNDSYEATNTNSLTGLNASLNDTPVDARILTKTMITELGGGDIFKLLGDYGGLGATLFGGGNEDQRGMQPGDGVQPEGLTGRGFAIGTPRRDGFLRSATSLMSSFDVESADVINGSNNLLYGSGDASGVVVVNSKRAMLNRITGTLNTKFDSEGSNIHSIDANYGKKQFGVRVNLIKSAARYYRPLLSTDEEGLQGSVTYRPFRFLSLYGDYRHYQRAAATSTGATLLVPTTNNLLLSNGVNLNNQATNYIVGYGGTQLLNGLVDFINNDSLLGAANRQHWVNKSNSVTADVTPSKYFAAQVRYGRDTRVNATMQPTSTSFYSPDHPSNGYRDAAGNRIMQWADNTSIQSYPYITGAQGLRATVVGNVNFGKWFGEHRPSGFYSDQRNWTLSRYSKFYEIDDAGNFVRNLATVTNADSGRNAMPSLWRPIFSNDLPFGLKDWPQDTIVHPNGKRYRLSPAADPGAVAKTTYNPYGLGGSVDAVGHATNPSYYQLDETQEHGWGGSLASKYWNGHIDTLVSYRRETAKALRLTTTEVKGPITYDSKAFGVVVDTPIPGVRAYANRSENSKISFNTDRDINNELLPLGKGRSLDVGLKLAMWDHRLSGSITYYKTDQLNNTATLGGFRNDIDPDGINGRHGGQGYLFSRTSDGLSVALSGRPLKSWTATLSFTQANGSERSNMVLPIFYNDEFNTTTLNGQTVVAVKNGASLSPLMVPSDPSDPTSSPVALSLAMMKDVNSPYFANLDPECGQILNADLLGLRTAGVGTGQNGLPIAKHQLGFVPPMPEIIVRKAGEPTTGYAENAWSMINRYQVSEGRLRGLVAGIATIYQQGFRAYRYTDAADGNKRKTFYYPDKLENNLFFVYGFKAFGKTRMTVQLNIDNAFDKQRVLALPRSTNGVIRYFRQQYTPRKSTLSASLMY